MENVINYVIMNFFIDNILKILIMNYLIHKYLFYLKLDSKENKKKCRVFSICVLIIFEGLLFLTI